MIGKGTEARALRVFVIAILSTATLAMIALSLQANYLFAYSFGQTDAAQHMFARASVIFDVWKALGLIIVTALWRHKQRIVALLLGLVWFACLVSGITSAIGVYVTDRMATTGGRAAVHDALESGERDLEEKQGRIVRLHATRTPAQVEAAIEAMFARPISPGEKTRGTIGSVSQRCSKEDRRTTDACSDVAKLREELAASVEATRLQQQVEDLRGQVGKLRSSGGTLTADPVGELFAWVSRGRVSVRDVGFGLPLFIALLIEAVSAFGLLGVARYAQVTRAIAAEELRAPAQLARAPAAVSLVAVSPARPPVSKPPRAVRPPRESPRLIESGRAVGDVAQFAVACLRPAPGALLEVRDLYPSYRTWCDDEGWRALAGDKFEELFVALCDLAGFARKREAGKTYCLNLELAA
jgi:hypothetical protein